MRTMQGGSLYHFYDGLWYDPAGARTHDLPRERVKTEANLIIYHPPIFVPLKSVTKHVEGKHCGHIVDINEVF